MTLIRIPSTQLDLPQNSVAVDRKELIRNRRETDDTSRRGDTKTVLQEVLHERRVALVGRRLYL